MIIQLLEGESIKYTVDNPDDVTIDKDASENIIRIKIDGNIGIDRDKEYMFTESENDEFVEVPSFYIFNMYSNIYYTLPSENATSSGDPHIDPVFGDSYELPDDPHVYRMVQGENLIMNAETRKITSEEKEYIKQYYNIRNPISVDNTQELYLHGCFYSKLYIKSENKYLMIDIDNEQVHVCTQSTGYFQMHKLGDVHHSFGSYKDNQIKSGMVCEFEHKQYGKIELYIFYYENPQINNGFHVNMKYDQAMHGLLIREHIIQNYILQQLTDVQTLAETKTTTHERRSVLLTQTQIEC